MSYKNIKEKVEERLEKQQAKKEFKDIGRVANTKKERSAYKLITSSVLTELELDAVMAFNMVKKDNVWKEIEILKEREKGVTSGAAYLKVKLREAIPNKPKDDKSARAMYVYFLDKFQDDLSNCLVVADILALRDRYDKFTRDEVIGFFINKEYLTLDAEQKQNFNQQLNKNNVFRNFYSNRIVRIFIKEIFGAKFYNLFFKASDAAIVNWKEAIKKEPVSETESEELVIANNERKQRFLELNNNSIESLKVMSEEELKKDMLSRISSQSVISDFKKDPEKYREFIISALTNRIKKGLVEFEEKEKSLIKKDNDWEWADPKKTEDASKANTPKRKPINTKAPLSYIKRTGGYAIKDIKTSDIIDKFGFSNLNYGNYVDDKWSKEHTKHLLGAMSDMAEMLNLNIKEFNKLGGLSLSFGAKGRKGHLATYFPQTKDINLTKANGDGSVAHEWGHYFDNVIIDMSEKKATPGFASKLRASIFFNDKIKQLFVEYFDFIFKGNEAVTPKIPMRFYAIEPKSAPSYSRRIAGIWEEVKLEFKETIEETIAQYTDFCVVSKDYHSTQTRFFGAILDFFKVETYDIPMKLKTSYFFHKSAYEWFHYCRKSFNTERTQIEMSVYPRTEYWISEVELFARSFETIILKKLMDAGRVSNYLVADIPMNDVVSEDYSSPYPQGPELAFLESILDKIVVEVKNHFNIPDFIPMSDERQDDFIELSKDGNAENELIIKKQPEYDQIESTLVASELTSSKEDIQEAIDLLMDLPETEENKEAIELLKDLL